MLASKFLDEFSSQWTLCGGEKYITKAGQKINDIFRKCMLENRMSVSWNNVPSDVYNYVKKQHLTKLEMNAIVSYLDLVEFDYVKRYERLEIDTADFQSFTEDEIHAMQSQLTITRVKRRDNNVYANSLTVKGQKIYFDRALFQITEMMMEKIRNEIYYVGCRMHIEDDDSGEEKHEDYFGVRLVKFIGTIMAQNGIEGSVSTVSFKNIEEKSESDSGDETKDYSKP